ncbi:MAG: BACON domain-containing protein [Deltaproteobacteria bacterium]|nr:BACON domain-containing protein [Deltaproteobacteria bacterium]
MVVVQQGASCLSSISPTNGSFTSGANSGTVTVTTQAGCPWGMLVNDAWITASPTGSPGPGSVSYSFGDNPGPGQRTGTVIIAGQTFTLTQAAPGCTYTIAPAAQNYPVAGGNGSINVTTQAGCAWTASTSAGWISITSGSGTGNGTVAYTVASNSGAARTGTVTIAGQVHTVTQDAGGGTCTYAISPTSQSVDAPGGSGTVTVTTDATCTWTAISNDSWLTISSGASGTGNGTVGYSIASNPGATRTGTLTIAGQTFTVTQAGSGTCSYALTPASQSFGVSGGSGTLTVTTQSGCAWTAVSNGNWITITSGSSGTGTGTIGYTVDSNSGASRTGTISVSGQVFTVTQSGSSCDFSISPSNQSFSIAGGTGSVNVTTASGCTWTAVSNDTWVTISSGPGGNGPGTVKYSVASNSGAARTGTMTIAGQTFTVAQQGTGSCSFTLNPSNRSYDANGGMGYFNVAASRTCSWSATTTETWISLTSNSTGTGNGTVNFTVDANSGSSRSGVIAVEGLLFTVSQQGVVTRTLNVAIDPTNAGRVSGSGIDCTTNCSQTFTQGAKVSLTATSFSGFTFDRWVGCTLPSGSSCTMTMDADKNLAAEFKAGPTPQATDGVWLSNAGRFLLMQTYDNGGASLVSTLDARNAIICYDCQVTNNVFDGVDIYNGTSYRFVMTFNSSTSATLTIYNLGQDARQATTESCVSFASANPVPISDGVWKDKNNLVNFYIQTYTGGGTLAILTKDGRSITTLFDNLVINNMFDGQDVYTGSESRLVFQFISQSLGTATFYDYKHGGTNSYETIHFTIVPAH